MGYNERTGTAPACGLSWKRASGDLLSVGLVRIARAFAIAALSGIKVGAAVRAGVVIMRMLHGSSSFAGLSLKNRERSSAALLVNLVGDGRLSENIGGSRKRK